MNTKRMKTVAGNGHDVAEKVISGQNREFLDNALFKAARSGDVLEVGELIRLGADINANGKGGHYPVGNTPLMESVYKGRLDVVTILLHYGADVNAKNEHGWTPLFWAVPKNRLAIVAVLLGRGADVNAKDKNGRTPYDWAERHSRYDIAQVLWAHGAVVKKDVLKVV